MTITYRTPGAWGPGKGANLTAAEVDGNFHGLATRLVAVETNPAQPAQIEAITSSGSALTITMDNGDVYGPLPVPAAALRFMGVWTPSTAYIKNDVVRYGNDVYYISADHMSQLAFTLAQTIGGFRNVKSARVFVSPKPSTPLGASRHVQSASVHVTMRIGSLAQEQVDAIATLVAGAQAGLKPESVAISDSSQSYHTSFGRAAATGGNLEHVLKIAEAVQARIATLLASIEGVRIAVNPQVVTTERTSTTTDYRDGISIPISEDTSTSATKGPAASREPGAVPNTGLAVVTSSNGGAETSSELSKNRYDSRIPGSTTIEKDSTGYATKIDVGVALPWSYFVRVWRLKNPDAPGAEAKVPDEAALAIIRDEEIARITKLVEPQASTDAVEGSKKGKIEVSWFYDFEEQVPQTSMAAGLGEFVLGGSSTGGMSGSGLIKPIGLGVLAIASLFFMFNIARKASVREDLPTAEELAGVPPKLESDDAEVVGEADEASPALEGMELDDDSLRRAQMLEQLNEMASRDPSELSGILRRWMRSPA